LGQVFARNLDEKVFSTMAHAPESLITEELRFTNEEGLNSINEQNQLGF